MAPPGNRGTETALTSQSFEEMYEPFCDGTQPPTRQRSGPRYYVTSLTGYAPDSWRPATTYQVIDSACGFNLVRETWGRKTAERCAARLNKLHEAEAELRARPRVPIPPGSRLRHGSYSGYVNLRCRCFDCTTAMRDRWKKWAAK